MRVFGNPGIDRNGQIGDAASEEVFPNPFASTDGIGVEIAAVSADSKEQLESHLEKLKVSFPLYYGLTTDQMKALGVYVSVPRSEQETDHNFAEPGLFVINEDHQVQVVDISNNPFVRPELEALVSGLGWIRNPDNNYPIRGTWSG